MSTILGRCGVEGCERPQRRLKWVYVWDDGDKEETRVAAPFCSHHDRMVAEDSSVRAAKAIKGPA